MIRTSISSATTTSLLTKGGSISGRIKKLIISNVDATDSCNYIVQLHDGSSATIIYNVDVPAKAALVLTDGIAFDSSVYNLQITTSTTAATLITII
jgi:hypothetical protein|tara:strand:+ start:864 stop:1151 length:288 start_codon:yes stop_codon:yes gene_type:complete